MVWGGFDVVWGGLEVVWWFGVVLMLFGVVWRWFGGGLGWFGVFQWILFHYFNVYVNPVLGLIVRAEIFYDTGFTFCKIFIFGFIGKSHKLYFES